MAWLTSLVKRVSTLTLQDAGTATETFTVGDHVYTLQAAVGTTANQVLIGASETASAANLAAAINLGDTAGTNYGSNTVENVYADASASGAVVTLTWKPYLGVLANGFSCAASGDVTVTTASTAGSGNPATFWTQVRSMSQVSSEILDAFNHFLGEEGA